jgi:REP element-mobilizing transposase RayT
VTVCTAGEESRFADPALAKPIFAALVDHPATLAACLMPDHLHWLLTDASQAVEVLRDFKSYSTWLFKQAGYRCQLWQRSFWDHVVRRGESLDNVVRYIVDNPVREGLVTEREDYPYWVVRVERFGS